MNDQEEFESYVEPHPELEPDEKTLIEAIRQAVQEVEFLVFSRIPKCRERSLARTNLQEVMFYAEAAIEKMGPKNV